MDGRCFLDVIFKMTLYVVLLNWILMLPGVLGQQGSNIASCPRHCVCFGTTVRCMFLHLEQIPSVPPETTILDLRFNRIAEIPPRSFSGLQYLHTLLLNNNHLKKIQNDTFVGLPELQYLYLYKNNIEEIESGAFRGLDKLEQLYIHFNTLESIHPGTFSNLPALERLFLHNNELKRLPKGAFSSLSNLRRLRLDSNALICDCQMMWLSEMLKEKQGHTEAAAICEEPNNVKGMSLLAVTGEDLHCRIPRLTVEPHDLEVAFGNTVQFNCRAEGDPEPEIVWFHNDVEIISNTVDSSSRYNVLTDGTLEIENTRHTDQGVYECLARNSAGEAKATAVELRYSESRARPQIVVGPDDQSVPQADFIVLVCQVSGQPTPNITWKKNDLPLPVDGRYVIHGNGSLTITNTEYSDRGLYRCTAANDAGLTSDFARVEVRLGPTFSQRPEDQTVVEGHSAFFSCDANADPPANIRWLLNGRQLPISPRINVNPSGTTLSIQRVDSADSGVYQCVAESNGGRNVASAELRVSSRALPTIVQEPAAANAPLGSTVVFECHAMGDPTPTIKWLKDEIPILAHGQKFQFAHDGSLIIQSIARRDEGVYMCLAENAAGTARAVARLQVADSRFNTIDSSIDTSFLNRTVTEAILRVNSAIDNTINDLRDPHKTRTPEDLLRLFRFPSRNALQISRAAEVFERTLEVLHREIQDGYSYNISHQEISYQDILSPSQIAVVSSLSGCSEHRRVISCDDMCYHQRYRTFDGTCNNLKHPMWGGSLTPLNRLLSPVYDNGFNLPMGWDPDKLYNGYKLPSARKISLAIASSASITEDEDMTHMLMQWGQFMDHDIDFVPQAVSNARFSDGRFCNETCDYQPPCFPISIPEDDPRIHRRRCIGVTRSSAVCGSGMTSLFFNSVSMREQINELTSYIDGSNVYGSSDESSRNLRDFTTHRGLLRVGLIMPSGKPLLPPNNGEPVDCQIDPNTGHVPCFQAGDVRANEQLGLLSMHTLFLREHNRIATKLLEVNPHWDGDTIYHETRKVIGAQIQHITYSHWLPKVLGPRGMERIGPYRGYDPNVDATIVNGFATAAFRFGHSLVNPFIFRLNSTFQPIPEGNLPLHKAFFAPYRIIEEGGIDPILRGLYGRAAKKLLPGEYLNTELTEKLFKLAHSVALDLAALNIQRARDHGLPGYNEYRKHCGLPAAHTFEDFKDEIKSFELRQKLLEVYGHPDNVDLWIGGLGEDVVEGAKMGPTFLCIIADQFKKLRDGDRFWYENPGVFTGAQLTEMQQSSLGRIICDNSDDISQLQLDVFRRAEYPDDMETCDSDNVPFIDFKVWAHCCHDCARAGDFRSITNHFRSRRSVDSTFVDNNNELEQADLQETIVPSQDHPEPQPQPQPLNSVDVDLQNTFEDELSPKGVMEEMIRMSHKMADALEIRIEGMEDVIISLQHTVRKLSRKLRKFGKNLEGIPVKGSSNCVDEDGKKRKSEEKWKVHDCRKCQCLKGRVECTKEMCPLPGCEYPQKIEGLCCPVCT